MRKIVLTGGPCSGKTSALPIIAAHFRAKDYHVVTVPEVPTLLSSNGVNLIKAFQMSPEALLYATLALQVELEYSIAGIANFIQNSKSIILCDRGFYDFRAYVPYELWMQVCRRLAETTRRAYYFSGPGYNHVVFMETAAKGAIQHFTNDNNPARNCSPELALELNHKTLKAWQDENFKPDVIDNSTDFDGKVNRVIASIETFLKDTYEIF